MPRHVHSRPTSPVTLDNHVTCAPQIPRPRAPSHPPLLKTATTLPPAPLPLLNNPHQNPRSIRNGTTNLSMEKPTVIFTLRSPPKNPTNIPSTAGQALTTKPMVLYTPTASGSSKHAFFSNSLHTVLSPPLSTSSPLSRALFQQHVRYPQHPQYFTTSPQPP